MLNSAEIYDNLNLYTSNVKVTKYTTGRIKEFAK